MESRMTADKYRPTVICIDSNKDGVLEGRLINPCLKEPVPFGNLMQMIFQMEDLLDEAQFSQPVAETRPFAQRAQGLSESEKGQMEPEGSIATFFIKVLFRQNASWQGSIIWTGKGREERFRSVLELMLLMRNALTDGEKIKMRRYA